MQNRTEVGLTLYVSATTGVFRLKMGLMLLLFYSKTKQKTMDGNQEKGKSIQKIKRHTGERTVDGTLRENCGSMN